MADASFSDYVRDQLQDLGPVECRAMFGGHGLYRNGVFFGILYRGRLYFKTDSTTRAAYEEQGMRAFRPRAGQTLKNYYEVPPDVLEDADLLVEWAREAVRVAESKK